ncbi:hypothetical protein OIU77_003680 [Salix suchowensis]|uniref:Uncharacterized protein n=1 Tax=Salix suchowensis TaxID=1278906 RepID=A0ABQ9B2G0_9ROSI|nr:hypothetical protein OIU77_003680 [Salix suchowensis]
MHDRKNNSFGVSSTESNHCTSEKNRIYTSHSTLSLYLSLYFFQFLDAKINDMNTRFSCFHLDPLMSC